MSGGSSVARARRLWCFGLEVRGLGLKAQDQRALKLRHDIKSGPPALGPHNTGTQQLE